ncbi:MAG: hypothetical protein QXK93_07490 [Candidatus Bathyarchaeia archaeon]
MSEEELDKLIRFIQYAREDINQIVKNISLLLPMQPELCELIQRAWEKEVYPKFDEMKNYLKNRRPLNELAVRGLSGSQLEVELRLYELRRKSFIQLMEKLRRPQQLGILKRIVRMLLYSIQTILESLCFIPGSEAIKQFKDALIDAVS